MRSCWGIWAVSKEANFLLFHLYWQAIPYPLHNNCNSFFLYSETSPSAFTSWTRHSNFVCDTFFPGLLLGQLQPDALSFAFSSTFLFLPLMTSCARETSVCGNLSWNHGGTDQHPFWSSVSLCLCTFLRFGSVVKELTISFFAIRYL